jgi:hypothetical protein
MKKRRRNPAWPFDRPENIVAIDLDPANLYQRMVDGHPCIGQTCRRKLHQIREPGACSFCRDVVEYMDSLPEAGQPDTAPKRRPEHLLETMARVEMEKRTKR